MNENFARQPELKQSKEILNAGKTINLKVFKDYDWLKNFGHLLVSSPYINIGLKFGFSAD